MSRPSACDFTACGWSDSILTSLIVRDGRVSGWTQTRCSRLTAAARLASTPPDWAAYAQRNAELAAALSRQEHGSGPG